MRAKNYKLIQYHKGMNTSIDPFLLEDGFVPLMQNVMMEKGVIKRDWGCSKLVESIPYPLVLDGFTALYGAYLPSEFGTDVVVEVAKSSLVEPLPLYGNLVYGDGGEMFVADIGWEILGHPIMMLEHKYQDGSISVFLNTTSMLYVLTSEGWKPLEYHYEPTCSMDMFGDVLIVSSHEYGIRRYNNGNPSTSFIQELKWLKASCVVSFFNYLMFGNCIENGYELPSRIRWMDTGKIDVWNSGNASFVDLSETNDSIVAIVPLMDRLVVYKERSIWEGVYIGYPQIFRFAPVLVKEGCVAPKTVSLQTVNGKATAHIFMGLGNVYVFDGRNLIAIGDQIKDELFGYLASLNQELIDKCHGSYLEVYDEYWLTVPSENGEFRMSYVYNFKWGYWRKRTWNNDVYCLQPWRRDWAKLWISYDDEEWSDLAGEKWNDPTVDIVPSEVLVGMNQFIRYLTFKSSSLDGWFPQAILESKEIEFESQQVRVLEVRVDVNGDVGVELQYSIDGGLNWVSCGARYGANKTINWGLNFTAERVRFRFLLQDGYVEIKKIAVVYMRRVEWQGS